jgi:hypothetical protein
MRRKGSISGSDNTSPTGPLSPVRTCVLRNREREREGVHGSY